MMNVERRRSLLVVLILAGLGLATAAGWYAWRRLTAPEPPEVVVPSDDPVLAEAVEAARDRVRQEPYSAVAWGNLGKLLRGSGFKEQAEVCFAQAERDLSGNGAPAPVAKAKRAEPKKARARR